jgi:hypothetical protein
MNSSNSRIGKSPCRSITTEGITARFAAITTFWTKNYRSSITSARTIISDTKIGSVLGRGATRRSKSVRITPDRRIVQQVVLARPRRDSKEMTLWRYNVHYRSAMNVSKYTPVTKRRTTTAQSNTPTCIVAENGSVGMIRRCPYCEEPIKKLAVEHHHENHPKKVFDPTLYYGRDRT